MLMWGSCQGSLLIQMEGRPNVGSLSVYDDVQKPALNLRDQTPSSKMCQDTPDECGIEVRNIDLSDTAIKHEDAEFSLTESSTLVNVRKQARDLLVSNEQEYEESILKAAPLGSLWTLHLHDKAHSTLRRMGKKGAGSLIPTLMNLMMISNGIWTSGTACALVAKTAVVLYEAKVLNNLRIVWQIDVAYLEAPRCYSQVIKVWYIGNHAHVKQCDEGIRSMRLNLTQHLKLVIRPKRSLGFSNAIDESACMKMFLCLVLHLCILVSAFNKLQHPVDFEILLNAIPTAKMLHKFSSANREYIFKQVDALFGVPSVYFDSKRLVHESMFEPLAFESWKDKLGVRL
ncbi:hypothetical protein HDU78_006252 [Chytriomyces hyalinus]|nr:hypothetical protein HDU78_006252 [Chytriomyces hyalinus]